ncbi:hypothetical protein ACFFTN_01280 [Aminobacter aganoensis]|uniref:Uncharacterized protein n=1 Tax=Aminobacter aganoensis TaxID=83264 RepID=A0A7X0F5N4_9HYPH|nr:hypothetical protein [Aminobacter aganoensis]MBB6353509.1 hypothetical protein [Aminobacter aganoensis]
MTLQDKLDCLNGIIQAKTTWLEQHGQGRNKRPDHEGERMRYQVETLHAIADDYRRSIERKGAAA